MEHGDVYRGLDCVIEAVGRVAGDRQELCAAALKPPRGGAQLRRGVSSPVKQRRRPVFDTGIIVDQYPQMVLITGRFGMYYDLMEQIDGGERPHAADDPNRLPLRLLSSPFDLQGIEEPAVGPQERALKRMHPA